MTSLSALPPAAAPYVGGALRAARAAGAFTALVSANPGAELADQVDIHLGVDTGPEAIAGSTRLKAATAHKMVLNNLSTAVMVAQGRTYSNLMVDVAASNDKLRGRVLNIVVEATGLDEDRCGAALAASGGVEDGSGRPARRLLPAAGARGAGGRRRERPRGPAHPRLRADKDAP